MVTAKLNGLNHRAYLEWLPAEMPNDQRLSEPGRVDRYLPWSEDVPASCRLATARVDKATALPDEPIVGAKAMEALSDNPQRPGGAAWKVVGSFQAALWKAVGSLQSSFWKVVGRFQSTGWKARRFPDYALLLALTNH